MGCAPRVSVLDEIVHVWIRAGLKRSAVLLLWRRSGSAGEWPLGIRQVDSRLARTTVSINMPAQNTRVPAMNKLDA